MHLISTSLIACMFALAGFAGGMASERAAYRPECVNLLLQAPGFAVQRNGVAVVEFGRP